MTTPWNAQPACYTTDLRPSTSGVNSHHRDVGRYGENLAAQYLTGSGWVIDERNWRPPRASTRTSRIDHAMDRPMPRGEIDIIARDPHAPGVGVIIEVKTRTSTRAGSPTQAITPRKYATLRALAASWASLTTRRVHHLRIDVIAIDLSNPHDPRLMHHKAVSAPWG